MSTLSDLRVVLPILWQKQVTNPYHTRWQDGIEGCIGSISIEGIEKLAAYPNFIYVPSKVVCICGSYRLVTTGTNILTYHCAKCKGSHSGFRHVMQHICWQLAHKAQCKISDVRIEWLELIMIEYLSQR